MADQVMLPYAITDWRPCLKRGGVRVAQAESGTRQHGSRCDGSEKAG
jgi:hypothetical protein